MRTGCRYLSLYRKVIYERKVSGPCLSGLGQTSSEKSRPNSKMRGKWCLHVNPRGQLESTTIQAQFYAEAVQRVCNAYFDSRTRDFGDMDWPNGRVLFFCFDVRKNDGCLPLRVQLGCNCSAPGSNPGPTGVQLGSKRGRTELFRTLACSLLFCLKKYTENYKNLEGLHLGC